MQVVVAMNNDKNASNTYLGAGAAWCMRVGLRCWLAMRHVCIYVCIYICGDLCKAHISNHVTEATLYIYLHT